MNKEIVRQEITAFSNRKGLSQNQTAQMLGVSSATLSNIANEYWERVDDTMLLKIWNTIKPLDWSLIETSNFISIFNACTKAKLRHKMVAIVGSTGFGKTTALLEYYRANPNTYYVSVNKTMSAKQFLQQVIKEMGISFDGSTFHLVEKIAEELNKQNNPQIIIDEAGKLSQRVMEYIHDLRNKTDYNASIVLVGVEYFQTNLEKAVRRNKEGMPEFYDRISTWLELSRPSKGEIKSICKVNGITDPVLLSNFTVSKNLRKLSNHIENELFNIQKMEVV